MSSLPLSLLDLSSIFSLIHLSVNHRPHNNHNNRTKLRKMKTSLKKYNPIEAWNILIGDLASFILRRLKGILWLVSELEMEVVVLEVCDGEERGVWRRWVEFGTGE